MEKILLSLLQIKKKYWLNILKKFSKLNNEVT